MIKKMFFLFVVAFLFTNCDPSSGTTEVNCNRLEIVPAKTVTGPETATVNQEFTLNVAFEVSNSCGNIRSFIEDNQSTATTKIIAIEAKYDSCFCEQKTFLRVVSYKFTPTTAGTYTFKFKVTGTTFKTVTVVAS